MIEDVVERAAQAMRDKAAELDLENDEDAWLLLARAALLAIRVPDEFMLDAGGDKIAAHFTEDPSDYLPREVEALLGFEPDSDDQFEGAGRRMAPMALEAWQAMLDDALEEV